MNEPSKRLDTWFAWSILMTAVFALVAPTPANATDTVVAHLREPSSIRTYADVQVFSAFEDGAYHLGVSSRRQSRASPGPTVASAFRRRHRPRP